LRTTNKNKEMEPAIGYIRVSTADQENSLEVQQLQIKEYARFKGITITEIFVDENISGGTEFNNRPAGKRLQAMLLETRNIIAIKPDRLFRNLKDALITTDEWNENDITLHIVDMGGVAMSTKTAMGRLMFSMIISYAEFEKNIAGERTKAVLKNKKDSGKIYSRPIFGFDSKEGQLIANRSEQEIIKKIKSLSVNMLPTEIAETLNHYGIKTKNGKVFRQSTISYILKNKIYDTI